jgi:hypothetical protein
MNKLASVRIASKINLTKALLKIACESKDSQSILRKRAALVDEIYDDLHTMGYLDKDAPEFIRAIKDPHEAQVVNGAIQVLEDLQDLPNTKEASEKNMGEVVGEICKLAQAQTLIEDLIKTASDEEQRKIAWEMSRINKDFLCEVLTGVCA